MEIVDLGSRGDLLIRQVASLLLESFRDTAPEAWPDFQTALNEVQASLATDRISRVAVEDGGNVVGWAGAVGGYRGNVWEIFPLVVRPDTRRKGIGRMLVRDIENQARKRGGLTIWVRTGKLVPATVPQPIDLFPGVIDHLPELQAQAGQLYRFFQHLGYEPIGVMPDANGPGRPDIFMGKSLRKL